MVPNLRHIVQRVRDRGGWSFRSKEGLCEYSEAVVEELNREDRDFGYLKKNPPQTHCVDAFGRLRGVDVALYKPTGQVVDFITSAGYEPDLTKPEPANGVAWGVGAEGEYPADAWLDPYDGEPPPPPGDDEGDPPPPPPARDLEARVLQLEQTIETLATKQRVEDINLNLRAVDKASVKTGELPDYVGTGRVGIFGGSFTVTSKPKP